MGVKKSPRLELIDIRLDLLGAPLLAGITETFESASISAITGANGSGKSTLMHCISGAIPDCRGAVRWNGIQLNGFPLRRRVRLGVGVQFQDVGAFATLSASENVLAAADAVAYRTDPTRLIKRPDRELGATVDALANMTVNEPHSVAAKLSWGTQRLVAITRTLAQAPTLILLDEPTAGLSAAAQDAVRDRLRHAAASGACIVLAEHNHDFVAQTCDRVLILGDGVLRSPSGTA